MGSEALPAFVTLTEKVGWTKGDEIVECHVCMGLTRGERGLVKKVVCCG